MEAFGDAWNGGSDDVAVERYDEDLQTHANDD
jgi:hypothetical protein